MADSNEEDSNETSNRKKKTRKVKVQNFIIGRARRRINSENAVTLAQTRAKFVHAGSISVQGTCVGLC